MRFLFSLVFCLICADVADGQSLFSDDFTRGTDPGPLAPWVNQEGTWTVTGGALVGGTNALNGFAFAYVSNNWADYSVQARIRFSSTSADAGGIGGRLNPVSGGHYAAWVLPDGSPDGPNTLQLVKFQYWLGYEYTNASFQPMARVSLPAVGTNWHTLKLAFQGNRIAVYYDTNLVMNVVDVESNPFRSGGALASMSTATTPFTFFVDDFTVTALPTLLMAVNDTYYASQNGSLTVPAPGVLNNDTPGPITNLTAVRLTNPSRGNLTFNSNGGFTYTPSNNFVGVDSFTYSASDGTSNSLPATVAIDVTASTNIFFDNFTRTGTGNAYAPWVVGLGEWNITGGVMLGAGTVQDYYSDTYIPGVVGDFTIQTKFQLPTGAWACGLSGRVNPVTGARYVANVYPEGSPLGPTPALRLIKFHTWGTWSSSFTAMALVGLPSVGTSQHSLKLAFYGNMIDVYFDGNLVVHAIDNNVDGLPPYRSGAFGAHMYMYSYYQATFDDLSVSALPPFNLPPVLTAQTNRTVAPLSAMVVTNTATDQDIPTNTLTYTLTGPTGSSIDTNGVITWTPTMVQNGTTNLFTTVVTDTCPGATNALHLSATNSFSVVVNNQSAVIVDSTSISAESCGPTNNAIDPGETVTVLFALRNTGAGSTSNLVATLQATGGIVSPSGPQNYGALAAGGSAVSQPFSFTANGSCGSVITANFQLQDGSNSLGNATIQLPLGQMSTIFTQNFDSVTAPALPSGWTTTASGAQANWVTQTGSGSTAPNTAFSADAVNVGVNELVTPVVLLPAGVSQLSFGNFYDLEVNATNPVEAFDGGVLEIKIGTNAFTDILTAGGSFVINGYDHTLSTLYSNPLGGRQAWSGNSGGYLTTLVNLPAAAANQSVQLKWRCGTDNSNGKTGWRVDSVGISGRSCCTAGALPVVAADTSSLSVEGCTPANNVVDPGETVTMLFGLKDIGAGNTTNLVATLLVTNGITAPSGAQNYGALVAGGVTVSQPFSFTATGACGGTVTATLQLQDGALNLGTVTFPIPLGAVGTVFTQNFDSVIAPALPAGWTTTASGVQSNWVTQTATNKTAPNAAFSPDPANIGVNELVSPAFALPTGASQLSFANYYDLETNGNNAAEAFDGGVLEIKIGTNAFSDILAAGGSFAANGYNLTISTNFGNPLGGRQAWSGTTSGFITTLVNLPASAAGQSVQLKWRCGTDNSNGKTGWRVDSIGVSGLLCCVSTNSGNSPPVLPAQPDRTIVELTTLTVTNTATDSNTPPSGLTYSLQNPPPGATISTNGIISWTPSEAQAPSTNTITTIVTDNTQLSGTNSFKVVVTETNSAPSLPGQTNRTIAELTLLVVTNTASDSDVPANVLSYSLQNPPAGATISSNGVINWMPTEAQGPSTNTITTMVTDNGIPPLSATNSFTVVVTEVNSAPSLPVQINRTIAELTALVVTNTASDTDIPANTLTYSLQNPPAGATIDTNGVINWTPSEAQGPSTNTITTIVTDNGVPPLSATNSLIVVVTEVNSAPTLPAQTNRTIAELTALIVTNTASDSDIPANVLTYSLQNPPAGATISTNGVINWTPTEAQGPGTNTITTIVTDNGIPPLSATNSFTVVVTEVNSAPSLPSQTNRTIAELTALVVTNTATDTDIPANVLAYSLQNPPIGATISSNGIINWTPTEAQGPSTNTITTVVTDNGIPPLSATNSFTVVVTEVNSAPSLPNQTNRTIAELTALVVTNTATDADLPANILTYSLLNAPAGATVSTNGVISWTPSEAQGPSTNTITTVVMDNGVPPLSATNSFTVVVTEVNNAPSLPVQTNRTIAELTTLVVTNTATDSDLPANHLVYSLENPPTGMTIDTNGVITWMPSEAQGPGTNTIVTVVTDDGAPPLSATNTFTIVVNEVNSPPVLPLQTNRTVAGLASLQVTNTATDTDIPSNALSYSLSGPTNAVIDTNGVISWTPVAAQAPSTNVFTIVVTDFNPWAVNSQHLSATNSFTVTVAAIHNGPSLAPQSDRTVNELTELVLTNQAADFDVPPTALTYELIDPPAGAAIDTNGVITWTPDEVQGPSTNVITTVVHDNGEPQLSATNAITIVVTELNAPPSLPLQTNYTISAASTLVVTNTGSDTDIPANTLNYALLEGPTNAAISAEGVITWSPVPAQVPSTNTITTVVTDFNPWAVNSQHLSATNSFVVTVTAIHNGPSLSAQPDRTMDELTSLIVTNAAGDSDIPALPLNYELVNPPAGATISTNGVITWTPDEAQGPSTNEFVTIVSDNGVPPLSATNMFTVVVDEVNSAPILPVQTNRTLNGFTTIVITNTATDSDIPVNALSYTFLTAPTNAVIDSEGVITWTPTAEQIPGTNIFETVVTDDNPLAVNSQHLSATNSFAVITEIHNPPALSPQPDITIDELSTLVVTNAASAFNNPALVFDYQLINPPGGATIDTNGVITWEISEAEGPSTNTITTLVTDSGNPPFTATNSFTVVVNELNTAPVLPAQSDRTIAGLATLAVTNTATDSDIPANPLSYELVTAPSNAVISANGIISWTPDTNQVPSTNIFETVVTDSSPFAVNAQHLSATNKFTVVVQAVHSAPVLPAQANRTILELVTLTVTNNATEDDVPPLPLTYELASPPVGAAIDTNGVITWTPGMSQCPTTNLITTIVSDGGGVSGMSATNSFLVIVQPQIINIQSIKVSNHIATITWSAVLNQKYRLQYKDSPLETNWTDLLPDITAGGSTASATNGITSSDQRFYRVYLAP